MGPVNFGGGTQNCCSFFPNNEPMPEYTPALKIWLSGRGGGGGVGVYSCTLVLPARPKLYFVYPILVKFALMLPENRRYFTRIRYIRKLGKG